MSQDQPPLILGGRSAEELIRKILENGEACGETPIECCQHETVRFPDGELKPRIHDNVRGRHVVSVHCLCGFDGSSVNDALVELLLFNDALSRASVGEVTVFMPFYAYGRQDRKDEGRTSVSASVVATCIEATLIGVPVRRFITFDLHNLAIEGSFRSVPCNPLTALTEFVPLLVAEGYTVLLSPDAGGTPRAESMLAMMADYHGGSPAAFPDGQPLMSFAYKRRRSARDVEIRWVADASAIHGRNVAIVDDIISTGTTASLVARTARDTLGARKVALCAPHAVCPGDAWKRLDLQAFDRVFIGNTLPVLERLPHPLPAHWTVVDLSTVIAEAIRQVHTSGSLTSLWKRRPSLPCVPRVGAGGP